MCGRVMHRTGYVAMSQRTSLPAVLFGLAAVVVIATGCGGGGNSVPAPHAAAQHSAAKTSLDGLIGTNVSARDRAILIAMAGKLPAAARARATLLNTTIAVAVMDSQGHIVRQFANRPHVSLVAKARTPDSTMPKGPVGATASRKPADISLLPGLGLGPYHKVISTSGHGSANAGSVNAPCDAIVSPGDVPYFALGGSTNQANSDVEAGAELIVDPDPTKNVYVPYMRYAGGPGLLLFPGNAVRLGDSLAASGSGDGTTFACDTNQSLQFELSFQVQTSGPADPNTSPLFDTIFSTVLSTSTGAVIFGLELPSADSNSPTAGWRGWTGLPPTGLPGCQQCYYSQTTSIALANPNNTGNDSYGPVQWSGMQIQFDADSPESIAYSECLNYPAWSIAVNECGATPADALDSTIQVSNQSLNNNFGTDTVSIVGGPVDTAVVDPNPDVFPGPTAATASVDRKRSSVTSIEGCDSRVDYDDPAPSKKLIYYVTATCRGGVSIAKTSVTFTSYQWNKPSQEEQLPAKGHVTENPVCQSTGPFTCRTADTPWPLVNGRSEYAKISNFYTVDNKGFRSRQPDGVMHDPLPINDKIVPYPLAVQTGRLVPDPTSLGQHFQDCTKKGGKQGATGCFPQPPSFALILGQYYAAVGYTIPPGALPNGKGKPTYDAHHILPRAWGGNNDGSNGIFLTNHLTPTNLHGVFSKWWCSFSMDGRYVRAAGPSTPEECRDIHEDELVRNVQ
jgi:hypothetical protein